MVGLLPDGVHMSYPKAPWACRAVPCLRVAPTLRRARAVRAAWGPVRGTAGGVSASRVTRASRWNGSAVDVGLGEAVWGVRGKAKAMLRGRTQGIARRGWGGRGGGALPARARPPPARQQTDCVNGQSVRRGMPCLSTTRRSAGELLGVCQTPDSNQRPLSPVGDWQHVLPGDSTQPMYRLDCSGKTRANGCNVSTVG